MGSGSKTNTQEPRSVTHMSSEPMTHHYIAYQFKARAGYFTTLVENMMSPEKQKSNNVDHSVVTEKDVNRSTGDSILFLKHTGLSVFTRLG